MRRERELRSYHGTILAVPDYNFMMKMEKQAGKIPKVSRVEYNTFGYVEEQNHVVQLGLYNKKVTSLPDTIGNLKSLTELYLNNNQLSSLPDTIGSLKSLTILNLTMNSLSSLPDTIKKWLKNLEKNSCDIYK